jgi:hypothetical protein
MNNTDFPTLYEAGYHETGSMRQSKKTRRNIDPRTAHTAQTLKFNNLSDVKVESKLSQKEQSLDITSIVNEKIKQAESNDKEKSLSIDLEKLIDNLSSQAQEHFEMVLREQQLTVAGFQSLFASNNSRYLAVQDTINKEEVRKVFFQLREDEKLQYIEICNYYDQLKQVFEARIAALQQAIANHSLESALLKQSITGNTSYFNSYSFMNWELGYRYGATFRLGEANEALEARKSAIGVKEEDSTIETSIIDIIEPSEFCSKIRKLLKDIVILKEEVTICNEALKKDIYEVAISGDLPRKYYIFHKQRLDKLKDLIVEIKKEFKNHIVELNKKISLESSTPDSLTSLAHKQELLELTKRVEMIETRQGEIETLLSSRKKYFKLEEKGLDIKEPIQLTNLSSEYQKALKLVQRITTLKEDIVLSNQWEHIAYPKQRRMIYCKISEKIEKLADEKKKFESEILSKRLGIIETAVATYKTYILNIQESMKAIDKHFDLLLRDAKERGKWQVDPPKVEAPSSTSQAEKKKVGFLNSWFGGNSYVKKSDTQFGANPKEDNG